MVLQNKMISIEFHLVSNTCIEMKLCALITTCVGFHLNKTHFLSPHNCCVTSSFLLLLNENGTPTGIGLTRKTLLQTRSRFIVHGALSSSNGFKKSKVEALARQWPRTSQSMWMLLLQMKMKKSKKFTIKKLHLQGSRNHDQRKSSKEPKREHLMK